MSNVLDFAAYDRRAFSILAKAGVKLDTIYDIGASNGSWSAHIWQEIGQRTFHMFEPLNEPYLEIRAWALNNHPGLILHNIALASETGEATFNVFQSEFSSTFLTIDNPSIKERRTVPVWRLDDYCEKHAVAPPDFIKADVQGFELAILKGGRARDPQRSGPPSGNLVLSRLRARHAPADRTDRVAQAARLSAGGARRHLRFRPHTRIVVSRRRVPPQGRPAIAAGRNRALAPVLLAS